MIDLDHVYQQLAELADRVNQLAEQQVVLLKKLNQAAVTTFALRDQLSARQQSGFKARYLEKCAERGVNPVTFEPLDDKEVVS